MAYWGHALALGPNINAPMAADDELIARDLVAKAKSLAKTDKERDFIAALAIRYPGDAAGRGEADRAYADAMRKLSKAYPDDLDAAVLFAEALMDLRPWDYWSPDGVATEFTPEILATLESVMERNIDHPGALHFYIHATEASTTPERALKAADHLRDLAPGAGHLVHMPAHTYIRTGRYADASLANIKAIAADDDYITQCRSQGIYPLAYHPHNIHFLWAAATMEGRSQVAIEAAEKLAAKVPLEMMNDPEMAMLHSFHATPWYALVRFGRFDEVLAKPLPDKKLVFETGVAHYTRGVALAAKGKHAEAEAELAGVSAAAEDESIKDLRVFGINTLTSILKVAEATLKGELAARRGDRDRAMVLLQKAILLEDGLLYTEPPDWHYPVRQTLGAVLLEAGRPEEATTVYWDDLRRHPKNGWSLYGLWQAMKATGDYRADEIRARFDEAFKAADVELTASRF